MQGGPQRPALLLIGLRSDSKGRAASAVVLVGGSEGLSSTASQTTQLASNDSRRHNGCIDYAATRALIVSSS
jgi:hypothetical protein